MFDKTYTVIASAESATDEVIELAESITDGWYLDKKIDWEDVWDRMDGSMLDDGTYIDMGTEFDTPAMRKIKREINKRRRES